MTAATLLANGADMCAIAAGVPAVTGRLVLEPASALSTIPLSCLGLFPTLAEAFLARYLFGACTSRFIDIKAHAGTWLGDLAVCYFDAIPLLGSSSGLT
jgi:hypothetical protein